MLVQQLLPLNPLVQKHLQFPVKPRGLPPFAHGLLLGPFVHGNVVSQLAPEYPDAHTQLQALFASVGVPPF